MASDILGHSFEISKVSFESDTDAILNLRKRKERVVYSAQTAPSNINMAFVQSQEVNSDDNLFLSDHSTELAANRIDNTDPVVFTGASFTIEVNTFLLTDEFTVATATHPSTPLFYKHLIDINRYDPSLDQILSLEVLDSSFRVVPNITELKVKTSAHDGTDFGTVFNNLQNTFDPLTQTYTAFYLRYSIKKGSQITTYVDVLNNKPVYREATFSDLDTFNNILPNRKVYIIEESSGSFLITLDVSQQYAVLQTLRSRIQAEKPPHRSSNDDWFISVTNGQFFTTEFNGIDTVKYAIPEFTSQLFEPFFPYKSSTREQLVRVSDTLFKTANGNLVIDPGQDFHIVVELLDEDGNLESSFSTATPGVGIRSVDQLNGFIDLFEKPKSGLTVHASYVYEEKRYQFTEVDFNPANNINVAQETIVLYVVPQTTPRERTLFFLRVDPLGKILFSSEAEFGDDHGTTIAARMADPLGFYYNKATINQKSFLDLYTVETSLTAPDPDYLANPGFLVVAELYVGEAISNRDINIVDIRRRGGGIRPLNRKLILEKNFESIWNWDIGAWDGQPYPGTATCFVEVPCELLVGHGGTFEETEIRPIVQQHMAMGVYPIIRSYGFSPIITSVDIRDTEVDLEWIYLGPNVTYNVYMATSKDGPFTLLNGLPLAVNTYTATGLSSQTKYWFFVTGIESGHECTDSDDLFILNLETR